MMTKKTQSQEFTRDQYNAIPAWSNSRLGQIKRILQGYADESKKSGALTFGIAFHESILEPHLFDPTTYALTGTQKSMLLAMQEAVFNTPDLAHAIQTGEHEKIFRWTDRVTHQPCKLRLDTHLQDVTIIDFKTTSANTLAEFNDHFYRFEYDRQAAMYLKGTGARTILFAGVQKRIHHPQIFIHEVHRNSQTDRVGSQKFRFLIRKAVTGGFPYIIKDYV
jgi:hypothetical protein